MSRLVVVSNRIAPPDEHAASAGGLAVGILGALKAAGGTLRGPLLTSANRTLTNTTTNSPMPFSGPLFIIGSIWCNFSVLPGMAIYA